MAWFKWDWLTKLLPSLSGVSWWLIKVVFGLLWKYVVQPIWARYQAMKEAKKIAEENLKKYREAIERGDEDEIGRIGSDILNGRRR